MFHPRSNLAIRVEEIIVFAQDSFSQIQRRYKNFVTRVHQGKARWNETRDEITKQRVDWMRAQAYEKKFPQVRAPWISRHTQEVTRPPSYVDGLILQINSFLNAVLEPSAPRCVPQKQSLTRERRPR